MSKLSDFDISKLVQQLNGEMEQTFFLAQEREQDDIFMLNSITTRFGQKVIDQNNEVPLIDGSRYPNEVGWEVELTYANRGTKRSAINNDSITRQESIIPLLDIVKTEPVNIIKGVDDVWQTRMQEYEIKTISNLVLVNEASLLEITKKYNSFLPWEFQTKALLLKQKFVPIQFKSFSHIPLSSFLIHTSRELKKVFKNVLSITEIETLKANILLLYLVMDKEYVDRLTMHVFTQNPG